jgi:hypothetical protein
VIVAFGSDIFTAGAPDLPRAHIGSKAEGVRRADAFCMHRSISGLQRFQEREDLVVIRMMGDFGDIFGVLHPVIGADYEHSAG